MKVIKRNQLVILVIALMLVTAGYLNYIERNNANGNAISTSSEVEMASIGDATLVNSGSLVENNDEENVIQSSISEQEHIDTNTVETDGKVANTDYFTNSKLQRDNMYSQMIESYQKMLDSTTMTAEQKAIAQNEIAKINETKNAIMICENLIKTKGFEEVIILVNDVNINAIVHDNSLTQEKIAQLQNIISREMKAQIENIHISNK